MKVKFDWRSLIYYLRYFKSHKPWLGRFRWKGKIKLNSNSFLTKPLSPSENSVSYFTQETTNPRSSQTSNIRIILTYSKPVCEAAKVSSLWKGWKLKINLLPTVDSISFWRFNYSTLNLITTNVQSPTTIANLIEQHAGDRKFNYFPFCVKYKFFFLLRSSMNVLASDNSYVVD